MRARPRALDDDGYLRIIGRRKDIVTAGGKNVAPAPLEHGVRAHWLVDECVVVGDNRPYVAALITLDATVFAGWKRDRGVPVDATVAELRADAALRAVVRGAIDAVNRGVSRAEAIRRFTILDADFHVGDELTPRRGRSGEHMSWPSSPTRSPRCTGVRRGSAASESFGIERRALLPYPCPHELLDRRPRNSLRRTAWITSIRWTRPFSISKTATRTPRWRSGRWP